MRSDIFSARRVAIILSIGPTPSLCGGAAAGFWIDGIIVFYATRTTHLRVVKRHLRYAPHLRTLVIHEYDLSVILPRLTGPLRGILDAELFGGNVIVEIASGWPMSNVNVWLKNRPFSQKYAND
jgi:hypothetical protein